MKEQKKKKSCLGSLLWWLILLIAIGVLAVSGYKLVTTLLEYKQAEDEYKDLEQYVQMEDEDTDTAEDEQSGEASGEEPQEDPGPQIDFASLKAINEDVIGWLVVDALDISYPIAQGTDNDYYLHRTIERTYNFAGSIFLEHENKSDFSDCNSIVYGHNMRNGSMFGTLKRFREQEIYEKSLYFWICTPEKNYRYRIFSAYETSVGSETYTLFSDTGAEYSAFLKNMMELTQIPTDQSGIDAGKRVVTLSTCTGNSATRFVVQGVCINDDRPLVKKAEKTTKNQDTNDNTEGADNEGTDTEASGDY